MCGIVGYIGENQAVPVLLNGLSKLEYRGYDSAGISVYHDGIHTIKVKGKLAGLREKVEKDDKKSSHIGIGHTRWATHGVPNEINKKSAAHTLWALCVRIILIYWLQSERTALC